jgi:hypothetical protein
MVVEKVGDQQKMWKHVNIMFMSGGGMVCTGHP